MRCAYCSRVMAKVLIFALLAASAPSIAFAQDAGGITAITQQAAELISDVLGFSAGVGSWVIIIAAAAGLFIVWLRSGPSVRLKSGSSANGSAYENCTKATRLRSPGRRVIRRTC